MVLPDRCFRTINPTFAFVSQCTYRCVVLPDEEWETELTQPEGCLNAPTGAWCSLTSLSESALCRPPCLNAPTGAWCSLTFRG